MSYEKEIYKGTTLSGLFQEIHEKSKKKDSQITDLILQLQELIEDIQDTTVVVPLIKDYLDVAIKNNEHLIKLATIVQRLEKDSGDSDGGGLPSYEELQELLEEGDEESESIDPDIVKKGLEKERKKKDNDSK